MVRPTRLRTLLLVLVLAGLLGWAGLRVWTAAGRELPMLPWATSGVMALLAVAVLVAGLPVRQWNRGRRSTPLDPLRAARTVVLAKSAQYAGALLGGWYVAQVVMIAPTIDVEPRRDLLVRALAAVLAAVLVAVAGRLVERFCRVDRHGGPDRGRSRGQSRGQSRDQGRGQSRDQGRERGRERGRDQGPDEPHGRADDGGRRSAYGREPRA